MKKLLITAAVLSIFLFAFTWHTDFVNEPHTPAAAADLELTTRTVTFENGTQAQLKLPGEFSVSVAAEDLGKARFMTWSPDGRLFIPDMVDYNLSHEGRIIILDDFDEEAGRFETVRTYLSGLRGPHNVAFYTDEEGQSWIYIPLTEHLVRYPYNPGDTTPHGEAEIIYEFPNAQNENTDGVVWHITRTVLFVGDTLYVSVGSGCNSCEQPADERRSMILAMTPEGDDVEVYAEGLKNAVGLEWVDDTLYATENGTDHLGPDAPDDLMFHVEEGAHYGWPYCYEFNGEKHEDTTRVWDNKNIDCNDMPISFTSFEPHAAPLGIEYFEDAHPLLDDHFLVALQGSFDPEIGTGYQIMRVSEDGEKNVFMSGFITENGGRLGRPVDILQKDKSSFFVTDDFNGRLYYIHTSE